MNAFERFGLKHLSPSSLNLWVSSPGLWTLRYLGKMKDEVGSAAWRGRAVETGLSRWLMHKDRKLAETEALAEFDNLVKTEGILDADTETERDLILPMLETGIVHLAGCPPLLATQLRVELWMDDVAVPVIGFIDLLFEDETFKEIKTTTRIPSITRPDHARQAALYKQARKRPGSVLYLSGKRAEEYEITDNECAMHLAQLRRAARSLQRFLDRCETPQDAMLSLPMNADEFKWSEQASNFINELEQDNDASGNGNGQLRERPAEKPELRINQGQ